MGSRNATLRTDSILPSFRGIYLERFLRLVESIDALKPNGQREVVCRELDWCHSLPHETIDRLKYQAMLMVLSDLMGQGWQTQFRQRSIFLTRPDYTRGKHLQLDPAIVKEQIRNAFREERLAKITAPSTVRFIRALENPPKGKLPVFDLIADCRALASDLRKLPSDTTVSDLRKVVSPYLQLARAKVRDSISGLKLLDIWRYFRYLWAIPYQPTPGRNLFYLVRDAARPNHPVIGIAALGNCVVQLSERDQDIGWSLEAIESTLRRRHRCITRDLPKGSPIPRVTETHYLETDREYLKRIRLYATLLCETMTRSLGEELSLINLDGLISAEERDRPTEALVRRLLATAENSERERLEDLRDFHAKGESVKRTENASSLADDSASPLYVKKRAQAIADVFFARMVFQEHRLSEAPLEALQRLLKIDEGRKALRIALHANKKTRIGSSMMDIIVCGAIPPYNELLGGKLVAMLMASPQVISEYRDLYGDQPGQIVSRVAGTPVVRPADLVFLTTTSLYHVGSSQYERIRIPGPRKRQIAFEFIGHTEGYGSTLLSTETTDCLRALAIQTHGMRRVNNIFGEGVSPRLRMTREGLALIGVPQDLVLRHNCPRLIYGVRLARNTFEYLRGETSEPEYVFSPAKSREGTEACREEGQDAGALCRPGACAARLDRSDHDRGTARPRADRRHGVQLRADRCRRRDGRGRLLPRRPTRHLDRSHAWLQVVGPGSPMYNHTGQRTEAPPRKPTRHSLRPTRCWP